MRLRLRILAILVFALIVASVPATSAHGQPDKPQLDLDTYLHRELQFLQKADPEELSDSMARIRKALKEDADTGDMLVAWFAEYHRRLAESDEFKDRKFPPLRPLVMPEGTNGWDDLIKSAKAADEYERADGKGAYADALDQIVWGEAIAKAHLKQTALTMDLVTKALEATHITAPNYGVGGDESFPLTALWRILVVRVCAHLTLDDRDAAVTDATSALCVLGRTDFGGSTLCELFAVVASSITFDGVLLRPTWTADELEKVLGSAAERSSRPDWILFSEAMTVLSAAKTIADMEKKEARSVFKMMRSGDTLLEDLLESRVESNLETIKVRADAAEWVRAHPGALRNSDYAKRLLEQLTEDGPASWRIRFARNLEPEAWLLAARIRLSWLRGKRDDALDANVRAIVEKSEALDAAVEGRIIRIWIKPDHALAPPKPDKPLCKVELVGE